MSDDRATTDASPTRSRRGFAVALGLSVAWTLFVWGTRIKNALSDDALTSAEKATSIAMAVVLIALAISAAGAVARRLGPAVTIVNVYLGATVAIWVIRVPQIWLTEHPNVSSQVAFNAVHTVLGVISIGLAAAVWRLRGSMAGASNDEVGLASVGRAESPAPAGHR